MITQLRYGKNFLRNARCEGATPGTPGTLPTNWFWFSGDPLSGVQFNVIGTGLENNIPYIDIGVAGTATASTTDALCLDVGNIIKAQQGQEWIYSAYLKLQSGSLNGATVALQITEWNSVPAVLAGNSATFTPVSSALPNGLFSYSYLTSNAACAGVQPDLVIGYTNGQAYSFTLRFGPGWITPGFARGIPALPPAGSPNFSQAAA